MLSLCLTILFLQKFIPKVCRCYNVFALGANHALYAILLLYVMKVFNGRKIVLLCGAGTCMASYFYAIYRLLRLKDVLILTVNSEEVKKLKITGRTKAAIKDIRNPNFSALVTLSPKLLTPTSSCSATLTRQRR